jgi:cell division protein FtsW (lipid II flippase)
LDAVRWFKKNVTKNEKGYELVVCKDDYKKYKKYRDRYASRQLLYLIIGVFFLVVGLIISPRLSTFVATAAILLVLYLLSLMSYMPELDLKRAR